MSFILRPWHVVFVALSCWVNQRQQQIIEFQNTEIEALLKKLGKAIFVQNLAMLERRLAGVGNNVSFAVENLLEVLQSDVEKITDTTRKALEEPNMRNW